MGSFPQVFPPKPCIRLSPPPYALHATPIAFFSIHLTFVLKQRKGFIRLSGWSSILHQHDPNLYTGYPFFVLYNQRSNCHLLTGLVCLVERMHYYLATISFLWDWLVSYGQPVCLWGVVLASKLTIHLKIPPRRSCKFHYCYILTSVAKMTFSEASNAIILVVSFTLKPV